MAGLGVPASDATVRVRMVNTTGVVVANARSFIQPVQEGHDFLNASVAAFLVENVASGKKVMFDLGVRKDYWNLPAGLRKRLVSIIPAVRVDKDTTEVLQENRVALEQISSVIWSHHHWDHTGSVELFPKTTELVVGPGFKSAPTLLPGYPDHPGSPIDARAVKGRTLTEIGFDDSNLEIGGFRAHDYFRDGSFYLLDTPGHCLGHMCGLARTTGGDYSTFVFLGGDVCHSPGCFRPSPQLPLPEIIPSGVLDDDPYFPTPCPASMFADRHPMKEDVGYDDQNSRLTKPFYHVSSHATSAYADPEEARRSVDKLIKFDADASILVCLAHDETVLCNLPTLNDSPKDDINEWKKRGYKDRVHWLWLNSLPRNGRPGRDRIVRGYWRDGEPWPEAADTLQRD